MAAFVSAREILKFLVITLFYFKLCTCKVDDSKHEGLYEDQFDVKPGGTEKNFAHKWDGITCTFTYLCQGGTNEQWLYRITKSKDGSEITCSVERPGGNSYLFFMLFEINISGGDVKEAQVYGENGAPLPSSQYILEKNLVKQKDGEFQSHLTKVEVYAVAGKQEL